MSIEPGSAYVIEYYALDNLRATDDVVGHLRKAENQALIGMIRHLYAGVDRARILDGAGNEINALRLPERAMEAI